MGLFHTPTGSGQYGVYRIKNGENAELITHCSSMADADSIADRLWEEIPNKSQVEVDSESPFQKICVLTPGKGYCYIYVAELGVWDMNITFLRIQAKKYGIDPTTSADEMRQSLDAIFKQKLRNLNPIPVTNTSMKTPCPN
jgi:hypothetical protein